MPLTPADVRNKRFGTTRFRGGYIDQEVDAFLDGIETTLDRMIQENAELRAEVAAVMRGSVPRVPPPRGSVLGPGGAIPGGIAGGPGGQDPGLVTAADVRNKHFGITRLQSGYIDEEVDEFLVEVETELGRLDQENAELRDRLVEFSRDWEMDPARFSAGVTRAAEVPVGEPPFPGPLSGGLVAGPPFRGDPAAGFVAAGPYQADPAGGFAAAVGGSVADGPVRSRSRRYWIQADMPAAVPLYAEVGLSIRICCDHSDSGGSSSGGVPVTLVAQTRFELAATSPLQQSVLVPESGGNSETARFTFHATYPGQFGVRVSAFAGGTFLGDVTAELSVERSGRLVRGATQTAELARTRAAPGEVTLHIRNDGAQYIFQLLSELQPLEPVVARALTDRPFEPAQRLAEALRTGHGARNVRGALEQAGAGLWFDMVPDLVKEQFWYLRGSITALSVLGDQDFIPWETLYPLARGESSGFLAEQFPVLHRVAGQRPSRLISLEPPLYVTPSGAASPAGLPAQPGGLPAQPAGLPAQPGGLPAQSGPSGVEISALRRRIGAGLGDVDDMDRLLDLIDTGGFGLLHFACHDSFRPDTAGSAVALGGGRLIPAFLNPAVVSRSLAGRAPLVFLNSSRSAARAPEYTRLAGWAEQFISAGAAAFVGPSWPVRPASATAFAEVFYEALQEGNPLGAAAAAARKAAAADTAEPSWLAYSVYGDPGASVHGSPS